MFIDAASFQKSNNLQITAILAQIAELPPILRYSYCNTLRILFWQGSSPDFNVVFEKHLIQLNTLLKNGLYIDSIGKKFQVRLFLNINDTVERAKVTNSMQFNGYYGCFHCMNPGEMIDGIKRYRYGQYDIRSNEMYHAQVQISETNKSTHFGIKGRCYLARYMTFPSACILDCMHLCYLGTTKRMLYRFFDTTTNTNQFYINTRTKKRIDESLLTAKYTNEMSRRQRSINDLHRYKASEYKNIIHHASIFIFKDQLPTNYYMHLVLYILFLRLLTSDDIDNSDIELAYRLILCFVSKYEDLYGTDDLTFNLHAHLHLPAQVHQYGPINKVSAFAFEGFFHFCKYLFSGTRNIDKQIAQNMAIDSYVHFNYNRYMRKIVSYRLLDFLDNALEIKSTKKDQLSNAVDINVNQIPENERFAICAYNDKLLDDDESILCSNRAIHDSKELNSFMYDRDKKLQNNVIRIKKENDTSYAQCCKFFQIKDNIVCVIYISRKKIFHRLF